MSTDRPVLSILLMLAFCIVAPMADAVAKVLGGTVPLGQVVSDLPKALNKADGKVMITME